MSILTWFGAVQILGESHAKDSLLRIRDDVQGTVRILKIPEKVLSMAATHSHLFLLSESAKVYAFHIDRVLEPIGTFICNEREWENVNEDVKCIVDKKEEYSKDEWKYEMKEGTSTNENTSSILMAAADSRLFLTMNDDERQQLLLIWDESKHELEYRRKVSQIQLPEEVNRITKIVSGHDHVLTLTDEGRVYAFGTGNHGELGTGEIASETEPVEVDLPEDVVVVDVAAGGWHSVSLTDSNDAYVWGWNHSGQLGEGMPKCVYSPTPLDYDEVITVAAADNRTVLKVRGEGTGDSDCTVITLGSKLSHGSEL